MENENQNVETETTTIESIEKNSENVVEKTFTQDEVNAIVKERLAKAQKGIPSKDELTKYNEWKESQKSQQDKYDELVKKENENLSTISTLQKENLVLKAGIMDADEVEFIVYKVGKMEGTVADNTTNINSLDIKHEDITKRVDNLEKTVLKITIAAAVIIAFIELFANAANIKQVFFPDKAPTQQIQINDR